MERFRPFKEAREFVHSLGLKNKVDWKDYRKSGQKPKDIPARPDHTYKDQWKDWGEWLGTGYIATTKRQYLDFEKAKEVVHKLGLKSVEQWNIWCRSGKKSDDVPARPDHTYKDQWKGWGDWLGTGYIAWGDWLRTPLPKQKLTLTINRDVLERAKKVGLNISDLTERTLDVLTYDLKTKDRPTGEQIADGYTSLFNYARALLEKYNTTITVGSKNSRSQPDSLLLLDGVKGLLVVEGSKKEILNPIDISEAVKFLFKPTIILENLLLAIVEIEEKNEERMIELRFAIRFLKALSSEVI